MHEEPSELAASPLPFSISEDLVPSTIKPPSQTVTLDFSGLLNPPLILQTNEKECGGQLWPAGMILAEYLLQHKMDELRGKMMFVRSDVSLHLRFHCVVWVNMLKYDSSVALSLVLVVGLLDSR